MTSKNLPGRARVVIVGGGVGGTSTAYHLAELGERDVILVDRADLTSGSTFHSAGLVGQLRSDPALTRMNMYSVELYRRLQEGENPPGWVECGGIRLAGTPERMEEIRRQIGWAAAYGLPLEEISAAEARRLFPLMSTEGVLGGAYLPTDGYVDPSQLTYALAAGARAGGVRTFTHTRVLGVGVRDGRVTGVRTDRGEVEAEVVVDAGGMFAAEIGRMAGVRVPIVPMSHQYLVTEALREHDGTRLPTLRDPDNLVYFREEVDGLLMGGYERESAPWALGPADRDAVPPDFNGRLLAEDWDRFEEITASSQRRVPAMADAGIRKLINGPEAFTPDNEFCLGETEVAGFFVAAGFCAHGIAGAGGIGRVMAEWIVAGEPSADVWHMDVRRFGAHYRSPSYTRKRTVENYETYYDIPYPDRQRAAGRPLRVSPAYGMHAALGAVFGEKAGWERVDFYESNAAGGSGPGPRGWAGRGWSPAIAAEHAATRESAGLFDESSFAKIEVTGPGAAGLMEWLCDNEVAREVGAVTYTQCLNVRGGIECDFTATRTGAESFLVVTGTAFGTRDLAWIRAHAPHDGSVRVADVTGQYACFALWGPRSRALLAGLTPDGLGNADFPYLTSREITVGDVPVRALRVTFVGELGWELYCSSEYGAALWRTLAGTGAVPGGYRAIDGLRLEKGYRVWGADLSPDVTPYEAGLGFCVRPGKPGGFLGAAALAEARERGLTRRLRCLTLDDPGAVCLGNEPVRVGDEVVGRVTSGGYGHTVGRSIAYAYLPVAAGEIGAEVEVGVFGTWVTAEVAREPLYDPRGERVRA
ncbi:FAD-dependent oxidoreductase [Actinomadura sp. DC4]|uniref:GcvT family protein n=1 Tax=Actinomadura sp. DC4 TaxID=3055069 RepID=UPI0025B0B7B2|nr:FAD-dependent oxidoreductase [Actinomadura sp. DC4]MDN3351645.1 FAD-dependent oxidoreductase [Actinomadura sp. DC4]